MTNPTSTLSISLLDAMGFALSKQPRAGSKKPVTRAMMKRYLDLERKVQRFEKNQVLQTLQLKQEQLTSLDGMIQQREGCHQQCVATVSKEMRDIAGAATAPFSVKSFFEDESSLAKEQSEYLDACNHEEMVRSGLEGMRRQREQVATEVQTMHSAAHRLENIYAEQDQLLNDIFHGQYGSERENVTESHLDALIAKHQRINTAKYKWSNSVILLQYAVNQLGVAVGCWQQLYAMPDMQRRYLVATQTRDNLISASRNIATAQTYLSHITFPYCTPDEVHTLNTATTNIYTDMQTQDRHAHALNLYTVNYQRAAGLQQWLQRVIISTIEPDLKSMADAVKSKKKELKAERLRLIREKLETIGSDGSDSDTEESDDEFAELQTDETRAAWFQPAILSLKQQAGDAEQGATKTRDEVDALMTLLRQTVRSQYGSVAGINKRGAEFQKLVLEVMAKQALVSQPEHMDTGDIHKATGDEDAAGKEGSGEPGKNVPAPLPLEELAPPPKQEDLFGDIEELKRRHEREIEELSKVQEMNKVRQEQELHAKLKARRNHRKRVDMQQQAQAS